MGSVKGERRNPYMNKDASVLMNIDGYAYPLKIDSKVGIIVGAYLGILF